MKITYNFWKNTVLQIKTKGLKLGYNVSIKNCDFGIYNYISNNTSVTNCKLGDYSYVGELSSISNTTIGKFCSIGPNVKIGLGEHPTNFLSTHPSFYSTHGQIGKVFTQENLFQEYLSTTIGNDVWIGANTVIKAGLSISNGVIVASGTILTCKTEPYGIYAGVPGKLIKKRFEEEIINELLRLKWWDFKDLNDLSKYQKNIEEFLKKHSKEEK